MIRLIILARILAPNDFGLMGIAMLTMIALETFSQSGFQQALIQKKEKTEEYLDVAWTFMALRNILLFVILLFTAPYIATFFNAPTATPIIRVIGISLLFGGPMGIGGFANIGVVYFQKELEFNKLFIYRLSGILADFVVAVSSAIILKSVWALVFGLLAGSVVRFFASYTIHPYRPQLNFDLIKAKELFDFGKYILGTQILKFFILHGDDAFLARMLGTTTLGYYQMAYRISNMVHTEFSGVIGRVTFPAYSKLQDEALKLRIGYLRVVQLTTLITFPITGGIFILAPEITRVVLGDKWLPIVPAMQVLCFLGALKTLGYGTLFEGVGRPDIPTKISLIRLGFMAAIIYPLTIKWGMVGTAISVLIATLCVLPIGIYHTMKIIHYKVKDFIKLISFPIIATIVMMLLIHILKGLTTGLGGFISVLLLIIVGMIVYLVSIYLLGLISDYKIIELAKGLREGLKV